MSVPSHFPKQNAAQPLLAFPLEWLSIAILAIADFILAPLTNLHFHFSLHLANLVAGPLLVGALLARKFLACRIQVTLEFFALILAAMPFLTIGTYIAIAQAWPLKDDQLLLADRFLGFDWLGWFRFVTQHPILDRYLSLLYSTLPIQILYFCLLMGLTAAFQRMRELFWLLFLALMLTMLISWWMPAMGPFEIFHLQSRGAFLPEIARVRSGVRLDISLEDLQGIITFPSFHTVMALAMIYGFRGTRFVGWVFALLNGFLLLGIPVFGGHYLVDMIAGAAVFALALVAVRVGMRDAARKDAVAMAIAPA